MTKADSANATCSVGISIEGMSCASCARRVEKGLSAVPGVVSAAVNFATGGAELVMQQGAPLAPVIGAIDLAGYHARMDTVELSIERMSCASCAARIEKALSAVPGVIEAGVNLATNRATVRVVAGAVGSSDLIQAVEAIGYDASAPSGGNGIPGNEDHVGHDEAAEVLRRDCLHAALLTLPVFTLEMVSHLVPDLHHWLGRQPGAWPLYAQFVLVSLVLFGPGLRFFRSGIPAFLRGAPEMNALVALGAGAAWAYSSVATFSPSVLPVGTANVYFEAAGVIVTLILLGRLLEARARGEAGAAIRALMDLQPKTATLLIDGGT